MSGGQQPDGVIHDIGYQHYDGPRHDTGYLVRSLFGESLRGCYGLGRAARSKVVPFGMLAIACLPALVIAVIVNVTGSDDLPVTHPEYLAQLQFVFAIFVAAQAPQAVSRDLRFGVVSLYFSRPLLRRDYVRAKFAAMTAALLVLTALPLTVLYVGALLAELAWWPQTRAYLYGLAGAVLLSLLLAGVGLVIAAVTPRRGLGVAAVVGVLLVSSAAGGIVQGLATSLDRTALAGWAGLMAVPTLADGVLVWLFDVKPSSLAGPPGTWGGPVFALVAAAAVLACYRLLSLPYRKAVAR